ncbi:MAG: PAS domain-containing protein, partial [Gammaproteobacteria bacterium]
MKSRRTPPHLVYPSGALRAFWDKDFGTLGRNNSKDNSNFTRSFFAEDVWMHFRPLLTRTQRDEMGVNRLHVFIRCGFCILPPVAALYLASNVANTLLAYIVVGALVWTYAVSEFVIRRVGNIAKTIEATSHDSESGVLPERWGGACGVVSQYVNTAIAREREQRKVLENERAFSEAVFRHVPDSLIVTDRSRNIIMANPQAELTFGFAPDT